MLFIVFTRLEKLNKALQHRYGFASTGQSLSRAFVNLLRKFLSQNHALNPAAELNVMCVMEATI